MEITNDDTNNEMETHYVYELNNGKGGSYFGVTKNPKRRITEHRNLKAKSLTSSVKLGKNFEMKISDALQGVGELKDILKLVKGLNAQNTKSGKKAPLKKKQAKA